MDTTVRCCRCKGEGWTGWSGGYRIVCASCRGNGLMIMTYVAVMRGVPVC